MRCITARPSRGDPSSSSCQFSATVCYVHYDCEAWGLGTYLLVGGSRVGSQAVCPSRVCPQPGPLFIVRASPILANATTFGCRYAVLCHGMACSVEREQPTTATSTAACQRHCHSVVSVGAGVQVHMLQVQVQVPQRQCPWDCLGLRAPRTARSSRTAAWVTRVGPLADDPGWRLKPCTACTACTAY